MTINIDVYPSDGAEKEYVNLENAEVTISNLCTTVGAFAIQYPATFSYNEKEDPTSDKNGTYREVAAEPITLVDPEDRTKSGWGKLPGVAGEDGQDDEDAEDDDESGRMRYTTRRYVMPPQTIPPTSGVGKPVLTVRVPKDDALGSQSSGEYVTYSGYIPEIMFNDNNIPEDIALKSGCELIITASIDSPSPNLIFAPVKVERWINKGEHKFKIKQAGIYSQADFAALITAYKNLQNSGTDEEKKKYLAQLEKYGYRADNDYFVFQLWASFTIDLDELPIAGTMTGDNPNFAFMFNGYTVTLTGEDGREERLTGAEGQLELFNMVKGDATHTFKGITSEEEFKTLLRKLKGEEPTTLDEMMQYGVLNNYDDTILFDINAEFDVALDDIYQSVPATFWGYAISFKIHEGKQVRVTFPEPDNETFITCNPGDYCPLSALIPRRTNGIRSAGEFYFLVDCYNKYFKIYGDNILKLFGTVSGSAWTFYFRDTMTLAGDKAFLSMIPDTANGRPNYNIGTVSNNITIEDEWVPASSNTGEDIYSMLSGTGKATGSNTLTTIVSNYNNNSNNRINYQKLWTCGRFDFEHKKWIFPLATSGQNITYTSLFGKMVPIESGGKYDYDFELGNYSYEVKSMPESQESSTTSSRYFYQSGSDSYNYPNTADDLKKIALGTYWDEP